MSDETIMPFDFPQDNPTIIKVIGKEKGVAFLSIAVQGWSMTRD